MTRTSRRRLWRGGTRLRGEPPSSDAADQVGVVDASAARRRSAPAAAARSRARRAATSAAGRWRRWSAARRAPGSTPWWMAGRRARPACSRTGRCRRCGRSPSSPCRRRASCRPCAAGRPPRARRRACSAPRRTRRLLFFSYSAGSDGRAVAVLRPQPRGRVEHRLRRLADLAVAEPEVADLGVEVRARSAPSGNRRCRRRRSGPGTCP